MTREQLEKFMSERPQLSLAGLSVEGGKGKSALRNSLPKYGEISPKVLSWLVPVLEKYGYLGATK